MTTDSDLSADVIAAADRWRAAVDEAARAFAAFAEPLAMAALPTAERWVAALPRIHPAPVRRHHHHPRGLTMGLPEVVGRCPACGAASLFLAGGGYVTCARIDCPRPDAVADLLDDAETEHVVVLSETGFTVRHPLRERLDDALMQCQLHEEIAAMSGPPAIPGRYRVHAVFSGWSWEPLTTTREDPGPLEGTDCPRHSTWRDCAVAGCPPPQEDAAAPVLVARVLRGDAGPTSGVGAGVPGRETAAEGLCRCGLLLPCPRHGDTTCGCGAVHTTTTTEESDHADH